jgi:hypothetical protein
MCCIVHCFILNGKYQGYLVISLYALNKLKGYKSGGKNQVSSIQDQASGINQEF